MTNIGGGLAVALAASGLFGSYLVFVKRYEVGDGVFFQFFMCVGVFAIGVLVNVFRSIQLCGDPGPCAPPFFIPIAMVGGLLWTAANMLTTFIIRRTGLGLGLLLWASVQMLVGWSTGFFGLFGISKANISAPGLNISGVVVATSALVVYVLIALNPHRGKANKSWATSGWEREKLVPMEGENPTYHSSSSSGKGASTRDTYTPATITPLAQALREEVSVATSQGSSIQSPQPSDDASPTPTPVPTSAAGHAAPEDASRMQSLELEGGGSKQGDLPLLSDVVLDTSNSGAAAADKDAQGGGFRALRWLTAPDPTHQLPHRTRMMSGAAGSPFVASDDADEPPAAPSFWNGRLIGALAALLAGALRGTNMVPPEAKLDEENHMDPMGRHVSSVDVVFPHFCGILLSSTLFTAIYVLVKKNRPFVNPRVALPAIISGMMFGVAQTLWFMANDMLSFALSFPIITTLPGLIGALWSIFVFKEITGKKNFLLLAVAFGLAIIAGIMIALSH